MQRIIIAGGGLAAAKTCEQLRAQGYAGELVVLCAERHAPYDRPPLTKAALTGTHDPTMRTDFQQLAVDVRPGTSATGLDPQAAVVRTTGGDLAYDGLVIATGACPVQLPGPGRQRVVRTRDDAEDLKSALRPGRHVLLIGASWISAEIATAAAQHGCSVTCLEQRSAPLELVLGSEVAERLRPWWSGIDLRTGVAVEAITDRGARLAGGDHVDADVVVTGVGVRPETGWLAESGLHCDRGVLVDEHLRTSHPGVYALGDVAARWSPRWNARLRVQHWDDARAAASTVAGAIMADPAAELPVHDPVPYFWSDQFGRKLQYVGHHGPADQAVLRGPDAEKWCAAWLAPDGRLTAHLSVDQPKQMIAARRAIDSGAAPDAAALTDPAATLAPSGS